MQFDLITFGETLIRLSPPKPACLEQAHCLDVNLAGSELNVAVAAKRLGLSVSYVTKVPNNALGRIVVNKCNEHGVDTSLIRMSEVGRQGIYFFEHGSPPRPGVGTYDRENSAFSLLDKGDFDWNTILQETNAFLTSGISLALGSSCFESCLSAVQSARQLGKIVCFDVNYRSKLWTTESAASRIRKILPWVDVLFTSASDARDILGYKEPPSEELAKKISSELGIPVVCLIYSLPKVKKPLWVVSCVAGREVYTVEQHRDLLTVDRLGAGDAFAGGFIAGYLKEGAELGVRTGDAMMALKNTFHGDFTWATPEMVEDFFAEEDEMIKR